MATLIKDAIVGVTCWELNSQLFKALVLPTYIWAMALKKGGGHLKIEVHSSVTYHTGILLAKFEGLLMELYALKVTMSI